ncbi:right-handed parallel beta-helix repeat-containing protein [Pseudonocardia alaniniphila]|uniref:Right-handed parallel beta-helix repeat-containing protein n=1 Tax=Pseudonocardia alaniniphila TaxID=75291 RepID=A0ABS9T962_9PSEU|nr:right-handed parallel beta-helix repeat-containing protein [Pseudonocardia alaniniphila]MCH6165057.1 right-handed parallel beta-helix repeat-containing protein [Pseudonocardia alaniniphila]
MIRSVARVVLVVAAFALLGSACARPLPEPLVPRHVPATAAVDPARPCSKPAPVAALASRDAPVGLDASYDSAMNTITLDHGEEVTLPALSAAVNRPKALQEVAPGEWLLGANIQVLAGASLRIAAPAVHWLKLSSDPAGFVSVRALGGGLDISGSCVTSWNVAQNRADTDNTDGRSFLLARDGSQMTIDHSELRFLGYGEVESYGLSWRTPGTGGRITDSVVSNLYYGLYTFEVSGLVVQNNEFYDNQLYAIDPHTNSHDLRIEGNTVHDNGKHGIILAQDCTDSVIRNNVVYNNADHGIVLYLNSNRNVVEGNESFDNADQGININESSNNTVRGNRIYGNHGSGVGVSLGDDNMLSQNQVRGNQQDGIRLVTDSAHTTVSDNVIGENVRYGLYVDSEGGFALSKNTIVQNRTGILLKGTATGPTKDNSVFDNQEDDIKDAPE